MKTFLDNFGNIEFDVNQYEKKKFFKKLFMRYHVKNKVIFAWSDMVNMMIWLNSEEYIRTWDTVNSMPTIPFLKSAVYYFEHCSECNANNWHKLMEGKENGQWVKKFVKDNPANNVQGIVFDSSENEWQFKAIFPDDKKWLAHKPFFSFRVWDIDSWAHECSLGDNMKIQTYSNQVLAFECMEILDTDHIFSKMDNDSLKNAAFNIIQKFLITNYFLMNFKQDVHVSNYDGRSLTESMPTKSKKQRARKMNIKLGQVYRIRACDKWLMRTRDEYRYTQSAGPRRTHWAPARVKEDYWDRWPERFDDASGEKVKYALPTEEEINEWLRYLRPLAEDEIFIKIKIPSSRWHRNPSLLKRDDGYKTNTYET